MNKEVTARAVAPIELPPPPDPRPQDDPIACAVIAEIVEGGYEGTAVEDVVRRAGVSREEFERRFESLEHCALDSFERIIGTDTSAPALYKWSREGGLEVESRLPGTNAIAAGEVRRPNAIGEPWTFRASSDDGETMYFSLIGSETGVYRRSGDQTMAISVSHISADDPTIVHEGVFDGASSDGRYAFFHTGTPLTEVGPPGNSVRISTATTPPATTLLSSPGQLPAAQDRSATSGVWARTVRPSTTSGIRMGPGRSHGEKA